MSSPVARRWLLEAAASIAGAVLIGWALAANGAWADRHLVPDFRMSRAELRIGTWAARAAAVALGLALLLAVRPWLGRLARERTLRSLAAAAAPTCAAVLLAFGAAELALRVAGPWIAPKAAHETPLRQADPEIGWTVRPGAVGGDFVAGRRVFYAFDAHGLRVGAPGQAVDLGRPTIVFAGESIMMGYGLPWSETTPAQVAAATGVQVADLAMGAYAPDQAYMRLRRQWRGFARPVAVVTLFLPGAFHRMLDPDRPHLDARLRWRPPGGEWRLAHVLRRHAPYYSEARVEAAAKATRAVLQAGAALAHARGAAALVVVPLLEPETRQEMAIRRRVLDGSGLDYVLVPIAPEWRLAGDRHPDSRGDRAMAQAIAARLAPVLPPAGDAPGRVAKVWATNR
jgi:hypothetical protein